ncbi:Oidioi.mRNA.OKI2018_I69.chr2.g5790.t1.cds [Oikopleura dioica]|uniref:Oidioi.mRNA.OKI2018_I69.chr2.g5790.t1.cds n=1 Tax=Oikopleura dioica TaxID=34765 RepID=A0ABN7T1Y3_OIKDI|nr:Oidioi.mRNA.OKI2018_I69.chr2.g5790.t1.cds [Oikopleura dioica]
MSRKPLTPLDFLTDTISPPKSESSTIKSPKIASVQTSPESIKKEQHSTYRKGASPTTYGPSPTELPPFERSASGAILLDRWGNDSPLISPRQSHQQNRHYQQNVPPNHFQQTAQPRIKPKQETIEDVQTRIKAEVDAARYKIAAAEAHNEVERFKKLLSEEVSCKEKLQMKLRSEISSHAQTVDQSRAISTLAQQQRAKNDEYQLKIEHLTVALGEMQKQNKEINEKLNMQNARVDALARICKGLETQLREVTVRHEGNLPQLDIAAQWRNHAYKAMVQANHTEARLNAKINNLQSESVNPRPYPPIQGPIKQRQLMPPFDN